MVRDGDRVVADTHRRFVLYASRFAPRWYVSREDIDQSALTAADDQTFCPYMGLAGYYDIGDNKGAACSYLEAWPEVQRVRGYLSFEPDKIEAYLDGGRQKLTPGQSVLPTASTAAWAPTRSWREAPGRTDPSYRTWAMGCNLEKQLGRLEWSW